MLISTIWVGVFRPCAAPAGKRRQPRRQAMTARQSEDQLYTYLLRMFCLLIAERSVSRTALKLNQSQPAVSLALKRLREILGDPLLVREKSGMVPTERALTLLSHAKGALAEGDLDVVIGNWPEPPHRMHLSMLLEDEIVCLVSATHPLAAKGFTAEDYQRAVHVVPMPYSISQRGVIDTVLAAQRMSRDERVVVQSFTLAPYVLQNTDLVFTTTRHFARFYADLLPLAILPAPLPFPAMRFYQLWHERNHHSPAHRWIRRLLADCGRSIKNRAAGRNTAAPSRRGHGKA